ncbi:ligase-associated DNA damage response exonuclease [Brevundimonas diminuta]|jgi:putative mRNA 3-end processing factor|uniref:Ligase-associated DNA damage response exonuclease n=1 Tax=Brevundimonas diminuta TaxID=293 RepID=A0A410NY84_BREDI|nr:ligase-associated DNA damage response exonuclease [Brevundimonas diminuta]MBD3572354.1 ligase-associated DNA damage response exonuclease [Brevundimonas diminuta]QAT14880.1 ligase-associated DNA damage response exonuclease [Brevundimonas diminuta]QQB87739.1 ligase-associated DNA damage response exonuclease [Brevundimonas diminuta]
MIRPQDLLRPAPAGLYCPIGDFYVDPVRPVDRAVITHGHSDHARPGHGAVLATPETLAIMAERYGPDFAGRVQPAACGEATTINGVAVRFAPAGHVLGSAQAVIERDGLIMVVSGDYKRRRDPTCLPFEPVRCHVFISEATFGLPVFIHPSDEEEIARLVHSLAQFPERAHLVGAYALGKAQRVIRLLREAGWDRTIHVHGALERLNRLYQNEGIDLGSLAPAIGLKAGALGGEVVIAPPSAIQDRWARRFADPVTAFASGWMGVRARARQRGVELPLVISDHADWPELIQTFEELAPEEIWITHGREEGLLRWAELKGVKARALRLVGYDEDDEETLCEPATA